MSDMTALWFLIVLALVFAAVWSYLGRHAHPKAKLGPDGTNVREPETFVVHHEGKGQGIDIANTALKERTEVVRRDLPGGAHKVEAPVPGRDMVRMSDPPSDVSKFDDQKVAAGEEPKDKMLMEGPKGSRPETPEEPGSPYAKGRRVTDNHRDVELAADLLPNAYPGQGRRVDRDMAASPSTNGQEPGYGLGKTATNSTDGEGGFGDPELANTTESGRGGRREMGRVIQFRSRAEEQGISFEPDPTFAQELGSELDWACLREKIPLPATYEEDDCVAMVRNPRSLYVYWERGGHGDENLKAIIGTAAWQTTIPCIRIWDVTSGAFPGQFGGRHLTIDVDDTADHWFINEGIEPGHEYVVSYERHTADGSRYWMLSRSTVVRTPHEAPAGETGMLHMEYGMRPGEWSGSQWR
jgi:hypothetical protein